MITVALLACELPIILVGGLLAVHFATDPQKRRLIRAYRKHRKDVDARYHIKWSNDLLPRKSVTTKGFRSTVIESMEDQ